MKVVDSQPHAWFLLQKGNDLFLDVNCSLGPVDYPFLLKLNEAERHLYEAGGREYIDHLAEKIHSSASGAIGTNSDYKDRSVHLLHGAEVTQSILNYRQRS